MTRIGLKEIAVQGIWLRRIGLHAQVLAEIDGQWRLLMQEVYDGCFSHIIEPAGIEAAPKDPVAEL